MWLADSRQITRHAARTLIDAGLVTVDGRPGRPGSACSRHCRGGRHAAGRAGPGSGKRRLAVMPSQPPSCPIVDEDDWLAVVDKPSGMVVHPAPGHPAGNARGCAQGARGRPGSRSVAASGPASCTASTGIRAGYWSFQDGGSPSQPCQAAQRPLARTHVLGAGARLASRGHRDPSTHQSHATPAIAGACHRRRRREAITDFPVVGAPHWAPRSRGVAAHRTHPPRSACTSPRSDTPSWVTRCTGRPDPALGRPASTRCAWRLRHPADGSGAVLRVADP